MKQKHRQPKKGKPVNWGLVVFEAIGWLVLASMLLGIYISSKTISVILDAKPIVQLSADTTGIVRLEGLVDSEIEVTEPGTLRHTYALVQKELFNWACSRSCDYKPDQDAKPKVSGSISVNDSKIQADRYLFYKSWLPLDSETVEPEHLSRIYEGGTTRPLFVEEHKNKAYGYRTVSPGERITVIGHAVNGQIEPFTISGNEEPVVLIGDNIGQMVAKEKEARTFYILIGLFVMLFLLPAMIGRFRRQNKRARS
ncbi:hypothetical protein D3P07_23920 [Paenibacillus sp. 1011MAR3C5]|uniref:hypothetical protein n=1 Tax=Paenibacillus sp. 1011MAR3C5 TaxID=1675787 RepID=UPI000E6C993E|nr:hypothetical protein [Paenibacillus sp. 1011MAR3C5]RJE83863.1 hypothetical protein D3P07_23920 [Paenibacillus sp. 1011MAR3C5]